jgi:negative regulator of sigma E activity
MKIAATILIGVVAGLSAAPAHAAPAGNATSLLTKAVQAQRTIAYRGEQVIATWQGDSTKVSLGRVEHAPPDWTRTEFSQLGSTRRWVVVREGGREIQYDPASRAGTVAPVVESDEDSVDDHVGWLLENYRVASSPSSLLGRRTDRLAITPITGNRSSRRLEIDRDTGVVLRFERVEPTGRVVQMVTFTTFDVMPKGWRAETALPGDLRLAQRQSVRRVTAPEIQRQFGGVPVSVAPPDGFRKTAEFLTLGPVPALRTMYTDGLSVLTVTAERGRIARPPAASRKVQTRTGPLWVRRSGG